MTPPRVSVLLPVYNCEKYLKESINSLLSQSFRDFEILAHDDGSTDASLRILHGFAARDQRLRVTASPNRGIIKTLNFLLSQAQGDYIARMDADDVSLPDRFDAQVRFLDQTGVVCAVGTQIQAVDPRGRKVFTFDLPRDHDEIDSLHLRFCTAMAHPSVMIRRSALVAVSGYREEARDSEDIDLWLRLGEIGRLANLPTLGLLYRVHPKSNSAQKRRSLVAAQRQVILAAKARRGMTGDVDVPAHANDADETLATLYERWGWWSLKEGENSTALLYGSKCLVRRPFHRGAVKLIVASMRNMVKTPMEA